MNRLLLLNQLRRDEGLRLRPYRCSAGRLTIGYGRNLEDRGITREEAEQLLRNDVDDLHRELLGLRQYVYLDPVRQVVLANMAFNLGVSGLRGFRRMLNAISLGDYALAAKEMLDSKWAVQVGERAVRLAEMMRSGKEPKK